MRTITMRIRILGIVSVLALISVEAQDAGCDGPRPSWGWQNRCSNCGGPSTPCAGTGSETYFYEKCGGCGYTYCDVQTATIGRRNVPCVSHENAQALFNLFDAWSVAYNDCVIDNRKDTGSGGVPRPCFNPDDPVVLAQLEAETYCQWHYCTLSPSGGDDILGNDVKCALGPENPGCCDTAINQTPSDPNHGLATITHQ